jgi:hypothetical protein
MGRIAALVNSWLNDVGAFGLRPNLAINFSHYYKACYLFYTLQKF